MSPAFPSTADFSGPLYMPSRFEGEVRDLEVVGTIPSELRGTFFQVGPDPAYPPMLGDDIYFNGDGIVSAFAFTDGHIDFRRRYVETARLKAQRAARRSLHGLYRNSFTDDPSVRGLSPSTANTNIVLFAGKLLAMKEDSPPYALDPSSLDTLGEWTFDGQIENAPFTAHPKRDPQSGRLLGMGYEARGPGTRDLVYYEFTDSGRKVQETWIEAPFAGMIHDFGFTANYVIFPLLPTISELERLKSGGRHFEWQPDLPYLFGIMRRDGDGTDLRWFTGPNCFQAHVLNAFEEDGVLHMDMPSANGNVFSFFPDAKGSAPAIETLDFELTRWTFDLRSDDHVAGLSPLYQGPCEFPRCDERFAGSHIRHAFMLGCDMARYAFERLGPPPFQFFNQVLHLDFETGQTEAYWAGDTECFQEPTFVPRGSDAPEGDGYLLTLVNHLAEASTELVILDTAKLGDGPLARVSLPVRLRMQLHGNWVPA